MSNTVTLAEVAHSWDISIRRLTQAWRLLDLPDAVRQQKAVAATIVATLVGDRQMGPTDAEAAQTVLRLVDEAWSDGLPAPDLYLVWCDGAGQLCRGKPHSAELAAGEGPVMIYGLRQWATGDQTIGAATEREPALHDGEGRRHPGTSRNVQNLKPAAKVGVWSAAVVAVLFLAAWIPLLVTGASRHQQGAVFLGIYGVVAIAGIVAAVRTGLRMRHQREQRGDG